MDPLPAMVILSVLTRSRTAGMRPRPWWRDTRVARSKPTG
jgi:hypothetical protein